MADGGLYTKPKRVPTTQTQNKKKPSKFYSNFLFKATIISIFLVTITLFPSEAPEIVSPSFFSRWWELLHLIFVGIAVSYGLFSRKKVDDDSEGDIDTAQSYVSKLLQVPSVFDDDADSPTGSPDNHIHNHSLNNNSKVQTWSSQYYRNEPKLVVANNSAIVDDNKSGFGEKPLLLPVRSLKSMVSDGNDVDSGVSRVYARSNSKESSNDSRRISRNDVKLVSEEDSGVSRGYARSNSGVSAKSGNDSRRMSRNDSVKSRGSVHSEFGSVNGDGEVSRSLSRTNSNSSSSSRGFSRISRKPSGGDYGGLDDEVVEERKEKVEESVVLPSPIPWRSRSGRLEVNKESIDSSLHSLPASLEESGAAQLLRSESSLSSRSSSSSSSPKKLSPSPTLSSPKKLSPAPSLSSESLAKSVEDYGRKKPVYSSHLPPPPPPPPPPPSHKSQFVKVNSSELNDEKSSRRKEFKRIWSEPKDIGGANREEPLNRSYTGFETKPRSGSDSSSVGKSVRTVRAGDMISARKSRDVDEENRRSVENDSESSDMSEKSERKTTGYNPISRGSFTEYPKETRDFLEQVLVRSDDDSESEDDNYVEERVETAKVEEPPSDNVDEGPDVDKKADEFIAKFREQIRLQRIESIKRTAGQLKRSSVR
ncbi:serine/threonine-protein kinase CST20-like [Chenopodium quinoa]|uniref:serine/threonine-protein kinase CST20-like n=1 Tax=Chenopodium quinoa TaxID=63459 RepID=UPI000B77D552|nr:serine/threonine-protein kinase CST20-like [Chenopodium quinoa]